MNENQVQKLDKVIAIIRGLCPRVDQYGTLAQPLAYCVNELIDVRDGLQKPETDKPENG